MVQLNGRNTLQWSDCPIEIASLVFFDIETTGLRPDRGARITEIAVIDRKGTQFSWQCDRDGPDDAVVARHLPSLFDHLRTGVVVGHNVGFDLHFVAYEADRLGCDGPQIRFIDTLGLARELLDIHDHRLGALLEALDLSADGELHTALVDAQATRSLFWKLADHGELETLADAGLKQLNWKTF